jgi:hypothetical protein
MNDILIEEGQFEFLSPTLPRPASFIRRFSQGFNRFYYTVDKDGKVELYSSATTLIKDGYAEDTVALEIWRNRLKAEGKNPESELNYLATRGTLMHMLIADYIQGIEINMNNFYEHFRVHHPETVGFEYTEVLNKDSDWLRKAVLAFGQFVIEYNVKPLALELIMKSDIYKVASPVDMLCQMEIEESGPWGEPLKSGPNKGEPKVIKRKKTIIAIVDFKSSQNGFYDKHYLQLQLYKRIVKENYPDLEVEGLYNWSPKDWRGNTPTYNLKEQSDGKLNDLCETVFEQGRIKHKWKTPTVTIFKDFVSMGTYDTEPFIEVLTLKDYLEKHHGTTKGEEDTEQTS